MKKFYIFTSLVLSISLMSFVGCGEDPDPGLFPTLVNPDQPAPVITAVDPPNVALAGITPLTITGQNFSPNKDDNKIYFNGVKGEIISSTPTQIVLIAPLVVADIVKIKVTTFKVENFSNEFIYKIAAGFEEYYPFDPNNNQLPFAITFDNNGNLLTSLQGLGIYKVTPDKQISEVVPKGAETKWDALRYFSNGDIYASKSLRGIWRLNQGVTPPNPPWGLAPAGTFLKDFDFDQNTNLWAVGANNVIFKVKQDASVTQYPFVAQLSASRVFNNYLYVGGLKSGVEGVWRLPIDANGDLGSEELYFNITANYPNVKVNTMTFSQDGDLYLGTNKNPDPVIVVKAGGAASESLYPGVIKAREIISMYWPAGNNLFITRAEYKEGTIIVFNQSIFRVDLQKPGAVYYNQ